MSLTQKEWEIFENIPKEHHRIMWKNYRDHIRAAEEGDKDVQLGNLNDFEDKPLKLTKKDKEWFKKHPNSLNDKSIKGFVLINDTGEIINVNHLEESNLKNDSYEFYDWDSSNFLWDKGNVRIKVTGADSEKEAKTVAWKFIKALSGVI